MNWSYSQYLWQLVWRQAAKTSVLGISMSINIQCNTHTVSEFFIDILVFEILLISLNLKTVTRQNVELKNRHLSPTEQTAVCPQKSKEDWGKTGFFLLIHTLHIKYLQKIGNASRKTQNQNWPPWSNDLCRGTLYICQCFLDKPPLYSH